MIDRPIRGEVVKPFVVEAGLQAVLTSDVQKLADLIADRRYALCVLDGGAARAGRGRIEVNRGGVSRGVILGGVDNESDSAWPGVVLAYFNVGRGSDLMDGLEDGEYFMQDELASLLIATANPPVAVQRRERFRLAKAQELMCQMVELSQSGRMTRMEGCGDWSRTDVERLILARDLIEQRCGEKLTLSTISRLTGINRSKLTNGFRDVFGKTVGDCLAEVRLLKAAAELAATVRPVSTVAYEAGYLNQASFTRAFNKRFGLPPSEYRRSGNYLIEQAA